MSANLLMPNITIITKTGYIEVSRMSQKNLPETSGLVLDSRIRETAQPGAHVLHKMPKLANTLMHSLSMNPGIRKGSETKSAEEESSSEYSGHNNSLPLSLGKANTYEPSTCHKASTELSRLREEKDILQRNFNHEVQYYVRQRIKDLITIQQLLLANQYQRLFKYVETQLQLLRKKHEGFLFEDDCCKPLPTRDTFIKSSIQDDFHYHELINNLIAHLAKNEKTGGSIMSNIKKLGSQVDITARRLANYLDQFPFEINSTTACLNLATKMINDLGLTQGKQIVELISKTVSQNSKGKYNITLQQVGLKSQMSKLIEQHSLTKIKSKKSSF